MPLMVLAINEKMTIRLLSKKYVAANISRPTDYNDRPKNINLN